MDFLARFKASCTKSTESGNGTRLKADGPTMPQSGLEVLNQPRRTPSQNCNHFSTIVPSKPLPAALVLASISKTWERNCHFRKLGGSWTASHSKALWAARGHSSGHSFFSSVKTKTCQCLNTESKVLNIKIFLKLSKKAVFGLYFFLVLRTVLNSII